MRIEILNWVKFNNPRKDIKSTSWFRFQNDYFTDPDFCDLPHDQKLVFPYLCAMASARMRGGIIDISESLICRVLDISHDTLQQCLKHIQYCGIIKIHTTRARNESVTDTARIRNVRVTKSARNVTERNETERNGTLEHSPDKDAINARAHNAQAHRSIEVSEADLAVGSEWLKMALQEMPWQAGRPGFTETAFAEAIAKLRRAIGMTEEETAALLAFVQRDKFWRRNALSPAGLMKKSDRNGCRKIDNILVRMKAEMENTVAGKYAAAMEWAAGSD